MDNTFKNHYIQDLLKYDLPYGLNKYKSEIEEHVREENNEKLLILLSNLLLESSSNKDTLLTEIISTCGNYLEVVSGINTYKLITEKVFKREINKDALVFDSLELEEFISRVYMYSTYTSEELSNKPLLAKNVNHDNHIDVEDIETAKNSIVAERVSTLALLTAITNEATYLPPIYHKTIYSMDASSKDTDTVKFERLLDKARGIISKHSSLKAKVNHIYKKHTGIVNDLRQKITDINKKSKLTEDVNKRKKAILNNSSTFLKTFNDDYFISENILLNHLKVLLIDAKPEQIKSGIGYNRIGTKKLSETVGYDIRELIK